MTYVLIYLFIGIELCILCLLNEFRRSPDATPVLGVVVKTTSVFVMFWPWMLPFYVRENYGYDIEKFFRRLMTGKK